MAKVKTHTFNGRKYKIDIDSIDGNCDQYACNERYLSIYADLKTQTGLITAVHESLHACNWAKTEDIVDNVSKDIGRFLWRLGYRIKEV